MTHVAMTKASECSATTHTIPSTSMQPHSKLFTTSLFHLLLRFPHRASRCLLHFLVWLVAFCSILFSILFLLGLFRSSGGFLLQRRKQSWQLQELGQVRLCLFDVLCDPRNLHLDLLELFCSL